MKKLLNNINNIKHVLIGVIVGTLIGGTGVFAANQLVVSPNPFPITANGIVTTDINALNVNGSTYLKLRDFNKLQGVGVMFDATNKDIEIVTNGMQKFTPDDVRCDKLSDGKYYITVGEARAKAKEFDYKIEKNINNLIPKYQLIKNGNIIIDNIPYLLTDGFDRMTYDYYVNTLMPLFK